MTTDAGRPRSLPQWPALLLLLTALRLAVAAWAPLSPDEAYYWVWSRVLAPGFLDHPPMVALWIRAGTALAGDTALGVRLLAPLAAAAGSLLLWDAGRALFPTTHTGTGIDAGVRAALLLNATLMLGVGAVTMTPDTPLILFWTAALWAAARLAAPGPGTGPGQGPSQGPGRTRGTWWLVVGVSAGLALDSKYTAALLGLGLALWLLTPAMRSWLRTPWPWAGAALAAALFAPVVWWNAAHGWASFAKQGGRTGDWQPTRAAQFLGELLAGQIGLATPLLFALFVAGVAAAARRWRDPAHGLLTAMVLPGAAVFVQHAAGDRVQANWVAVLYPAAALAAAGLASRWSRPATWSGAAITAAVYLQAVAQFPLPRTLDPTSRMAGWTDLARAAAARADGTPLASEEYGQASLLAFAAPGTPVLGAESRWALTGLPHAGPVPTLLLLISDRRREGPDPAFWDAAEPAGTLQRRRGGVVLESFRLYRAHPRPGAPLARLPQPTLPHPTPPHPDP